MQTSDGSVDLSSAWLATGLVIGWCMVFYEGVLIGPPSSLFVSQSFVLIPAQRMKLGAALLYETLALRSKRKVLSQ